MQNSKLCIALAVAGLIAVQPVQAGEREELESLRQTTLAIIDALVEKGILDKEAAEAMVKQAEAKGREQAEAVARADAGVVRVPYIPEVVKREIREQIRQEVVAQARTERWGDVNAVPEWVSRIKLEGDFRLRYQNDLFASGNASGNDFVDTPYGLGSTDSPINTAEDRKRGRIRARLGLLAKLTDTVSTGFRITTGNTSDPVSTNQTLGNSFNKNSLVLDRAYAKVEPSDWLSVSGGRIPNPFFSTDLVWDDDLNFDGIAATFKPWPQAVMDAKPFITFGAFPLQEVETSNTNLAKDKWLFATQAGLDWHSGAFSRWRFGLAYYDYSNIRAVADPTVDGLYDYANSILSYRQKGNTVFEVAPTDAAGRYGLASDYRLANLTAMADFSHFDPLHVILSADVVKNLGYKLSDDARTQLGSDYKERTLGWQAKVTVGKPSIELPGDWQVYLGYRHLERDAVLDAFADSDFRLGGTNSKGYYLGGSYGVDRNAWLSAKWLSADQIDGPALGVDVLQVDFNAKF